MMLTTILGFPPVPDETPHWPPPWWPWPQRTKENHIG